jgi:hypothetical protein
MVSGFVRPDQDIVQGFKTRRVVLILRGTHAQGYRLLAS